MNEEENRDRKQSGTEGKKRRIKTRREGTGTRGKENERRESQSEGDEEDETRGDCAKQRSSSRCLPREQKKKKERSKVRASGPDTDRFSRDTDEEEEGAGRKEDKGIYLPVQREYPRQAKSRRAGKQFQRCLYVVPRFAKKCYLIIFLSYEDAERRPAKAHIRKY